VDQDFGRSAFVTDGVPLLFDRRDLAENPVPLILNNFGLIQMQYSLSLSLSFFLFFGGRGDKTLALPGVPVAYVHYHASRSNFWKMEKIISDLSYKVNYTS